MIFKVRNLRQELRDIAAKFHAAGRHGYAGFLDELCNRPSFKVTRREIRRQQRILKKWTK